MVKKIDINKPILAKNDEIAALIRNKLSDQKILAINLISSPGSGKTSLLERTLGAMHDRLRMAIIAGDVQTENDADRLKKAGPAQIQPIVTGGACHLDANMVKNALDKIVLDEIDLLFIENVGNLVCPASYDLGEETKVVVVSVAEGEDKPLKYPAVFRKASVCIWNKIDLLSHTDFDLEKARQNATYVNAILKMFDMSCRSEEGMANWYSWLNNQVARKKGKYPD